MTSLLHPRMRDAAILLTVLLGTTPGRAAEIDPYVPLDTETVVNINVRQILDSPLIKKNALEAAQELLRGNDQVQDVLKDLGFDPFKDLDRVILATPGGTDKDRGLIIVHGRFDLAKFKAKAEQVAKDQSENLKIHKVLAGKHIIYEVNVPDMDDPLFVALASRDTLLASPGKDYVVDALKKIGKTDKLALKNKDFQALLEKVDDRQSLSVAAVKNPAVKDAVGSLPGDVKDMLDKIQAIGGGLTLSDEIKLELVVTTKNADEAKELRDSANAGLTLITAVLGGLNKDAKPQIEFVLEVVKSLRISNKGQTVVVKGRISSDLIEEALKKSK
ncbi:MAG TPA: hypothetical protein VN688_31675 [Gemmataceae bacterium]|nr:hypothetical protein [Gemmataceae bacterium]